MIVPVVLSSFIGCFRYHHHRRPDQAFVQQITFLHHGNDGIRLDFSAGLPERLACTPEQLNRTGPELAALPPFDQAIVLADSRPQVLETVYALQDQGDLFAQAASELGLTIDTALPE